MGRVMFGQIDDYRFGSIGKAAYFLFQITTLENWSDCWYDNRDAAPTMWIFLVAYVVFANFIFINLFIAVIVSNLQQVNDKLKEHRKKRSKRKAILAAEKRKQEQALQELLENEELIMDFTEYDEFIQSLAGLSSASGLQIDGNERLSSK
jgi:hypothetical protein